MTVIYLDQLAQVQHGHSENAARPAVAISNALFYLMKDAEAIGENDLAYLMGLAAFEAGGPFKEAHHRAPAGEVLDRSQVLWGIRDCLDKLQAEAEQAGEEVISGLISLAREAAARRIDAGTCSIIDYRGKLTE